jgi:hypothetical protein
LALVNCFIDCDFGVWHQKIEGASKTVCAMALPLQKTSLPRLLSRFLALRQRMPKSPPSMLKPKASLKYV